ncbi:MAG: cupredoxin domain-containing protein [Cyanobacteria bacterium REEB65]|nr:cupredoxin domain-containing protein [Cyanobacteria bacterium REEB65]
MKTQASTNPTPTPSPGASSGTTAQAAAVTLSGFAFNPQSLTVKAGTAVTFTNKDSVGHTVTPDNAGEFTGSGTLTGGQSQTITFAQPGTYAYHCSIHPSMTGTIVVD